MIPNDVVSLNFAEIRVEYHPQKADGSLDAKWQAGYDLKSGKGSY